MRRNETRSFKMYDFRYALTIAFPGKAYPVNLSTVLRVLLYSPVRTPAFPIIRERNPFLRFLPSEIPSRSKTVLYANI